MIALVLAATAALVVTVVVPGRRARPIHAGSDRRRAARVRRPGTIACVVAVALGPLLGVEAAAVALGVVALVATGAAVARGWHGRRQRRRRQLAVIAFCDALSAELQAGLPALVALQRSCEVDVELHPIGVGAQLGVDVPVQLRALASRPGFEALRSVAAGWKVASHTGAGLATVLESIGVGLRHDEDARAETQAALGPPRATARMLAVLPLLGLGLGESMGVHPTAFLVRTTLGRLCLVVGLVLAVAGVLWVDRIAQSAESVGGVR